MKRVLSILLTAVLLITTATFASASTPAVMPAAETQTTGGEPAAGHKAQALAKDETVYVTLNADGSMASMYVVNHLETPADGVYTDYGNYTDIRNLTDSQEPTVRGDEISFTRSKSEKGLYYQGTPVGGALPFTYAFEYTLDGKAMDPQELIGKSGKVEITIKVHPNPDAKPYFAENYLSQIQLPLNLDVCSKISAPGATTVIVGRTATLAYMAMAGREGEYHLSFEAKDFSMDAISITCSYFDINSFVNVDTQEIKDAVGQMSDATGQLYDGTLQLKKGLTALSGGLDQLADGAAQAKDGAGALTGGIDEYTNAVNALSDGCDEITAAVNSFAEQGEKMLGYYRDIKVRVEEALSCVKELITTLVPEEYQQKAMELLKKAEDQLASVDKKINELSDGIQQLVGGIRSLNDGLAQLKANSGSLKEGAAQMREGLTALSSGLDQISSQSAAIPSEVQKLADGQQLLHEGIGESSSYLDQFDFLEKSEEGSTPVSFVSDKIVPNSVQFVIQTPALTKETPKEEVKEEVEEKSFFDRLLDLFR